MSLSSLISMLHRPIPLLNTPPHINTGRKRVGSIGGTPPFPLSPQYMLFVRACDFRPSALFRILASLLSTISHHLLRRALLLSSSVPLSPRPMISFSTFI